MYVSILIWENRSCRKYTQSKKQLFIFSIKTFLQTRHTKQICRDASCRKYLTCVKDLKVYLKHFKKFSKNDSYWRISSKFSQLTFSWYKFSHLLVTKELSNFISKVSINEKYDIAKDPVSKADEINRALKSLHKSLCVLLKVW